MSDEVESSSAHYELIGAIATAWAGLEFEIDMLLWALVGGRQHRLACLTAQMVSIHARLNALTSICHVRNIGKDTLAKLKSFAGSTGGLAEARNRAVHDPLVRMGQASEVYRITITAKGAPAFGPVAQPIEALRDTLRKIIKCKDDFQGVHTAIVAELRAQPEEPPLPHAQLYPLR